MGVTRMGKTTIFLADDDEGVRRTLRTFFEGLPGYRVVGEACDGMEAVEGCRASAPDVALLDIQMPLLDGVSVARQVLADRAAKCVIILTAFSDREHIERVQGRRGTSPSLLRRRRFCLPSSCVLRAARSTTC